MKAFEILKRELRANINPGSSWLHGAKTLKLTIYKGQLKPRKWYFFKFNKPYLEEQADVVLSLGTDEKQYLFEIDR